MTAPLIACRELPVTQAGDGLPADGADASASGLAEVAGHHGEVLQGAFVCPGTGTVRALYTLPCPLFRSRARFVPCEGPLRVSPASRTKARAVVELLIDRLDLWPRGGRLEIVSDIPSGHGLGASTGDVVAALRAVERAHAIHISEADAARFAVQAEVAADPLILDDTNILFAHREGRVLERLGGRLMPLTVVGFHTVERPRGVPTVSLKPARYDSRELAAFDVLRSTPATLPAHGGRRVARGGRDGEQPDEPAVPARAPARRADRLRHRRRGRRPPGRPQR